MVIGQPPTGPCDPDGQTAGCVQAEKPHTGDTVTVHIGPDVRLVKCRDSGNGREPPGSHSRHVKRYEADPRRAVACVDHKVGRQHRGETLGRNPPVQERQAVPILITDRIAFWSPRRRQPIQFDHVRSGSESTGNPLRLTGGIPGNRGRFFQGRQWHLHRLKRWSWLRQRTVSGGNRLQWRWCLAGRRLGLDRRCLGGGSFLGRWCWRLPRSFRDGRRQWRRWKFTLLVK